MASLILVISIILIIISIILSNSDNYCCCDWVEGISIVSFIFCVLSFIVEGYCLIDVGNSKYIPEKIAMYEEENQKIEQDIATMVKEYMQYEGDTFKEISGESAITLVNLYPELKSSELVTQQIDIHTENNKKIKELKEDLIDAKMSKYLLYFGGK